MIKVNLNICGKTNKQVGLVEIVNVTRCVGRVSSDYYWRVSVKNIRGEKKTTTGLIVDCSTDDAMQLLADVLSLWRTNRPALDNHGLLVKQAESMTLTPEEYWKKFDRYELKSKSK